jgi:hypothetical protein
LGATVRRIVGGPATLSMKFAISSADGSGRPSFCRYAAVSTSLWL